jgi:hypothetical protein
MEEPNSNPTGLSMMHLYSTIAGHDHRLVLTGDGADEIFGGYKRYELALKTDFFPSFNLSYLKHLIEEKNPNMRFMTKILLNFSNHGSDQYWLFWHLLVGKNAIREIVTDLPYPTPKIIGLELSEYFTLTAASGMLFRDLRTWLTMESNRKLDFFETQTAELSTIGKLSSGDENRLLRESHRRYKISTITLTDLLDKYHAPEHIEYLSIDTEGSEISSTTTMHSNSISKVSMILTNVFFKTSPSL